MLYGRAECHSGQWPWLPRTATGPDTFLPPPCPPTGQPGSASCRKAAAHTATAQHHTGDCSRNMTANFKDALWPSSGQLDHPPPQGGRGFSGCWGAQQLHEMDGQELETENSSKHSVAPGRAGSSSLLKCDTFLSCFLKKDLGSNPTFYHLLAVWPSVNDGRSLSLSRHL